jgi:hypothetical protein
MPPEPPFIQRHNNQVKVLPVSIGRNTHYKPALKHNNNKSTELKFVSARDDLDSPHENSTVYPRPANFNTHNRQTNHNSLSRGGHMGGGYNPYGGGMFPGGMYGGMMMGGMMGHPGAGGGMMGFLYTMNYFVNMASQVVYFLGMNSHRITEAVKSAKTALVNLEKIVRQSEFRRWMQRKSKKSVILRYLFVFMSAVLAHQLTTIARFAIEHYLSGSSSSSASQRVTSSAIAGIASASNAVTSSTGTVSNGGINAIGGL